MKMSKKIKLFLASALLVVALLLTTFGCSAIYVVSFDSNGGTEVKAVDVFVGETAEKPEDPTKEGYTFAGWFLGEEEFSFESIIEKDFTLTAKWTPNTDTLYTVKHLHEKLDGSGYEEVTADTESLQGTTDANTNAVAKSYEGFTALAIEQKQIAPDGSTVVEVKYNRNLITVTWVIDGVPTEQDYKYGATPSRANPTKDADNTYTYEFSGWDSELVAVTEEKTYTAQFNASYINYTVEFLDVDGQTVSSKTDYHYGDTIVVPTETPTKDADNTYTYEFSGWNNDEKVVGNKQYTPLFTPVYINYSVEFKGLNGETISSKTDYHYGDTVIVPEHSENLPGYTYGWNKEVVAVNGNTVYTETKEPKTYNVTLVLNGGEAESELTSYVYGVGATLPDASKLGHSFVGWYSNSDFSGEKVTAISANDLEDKTFYAQWDPKTYNVTLFAGDGSADFALTSYVYGVGATLPECTKKGYDFVGWCASEDLSGEAVREITTTDIEDKVFYAKYEARNDTKYSIQVLVAQYAGNYIVGYYYPSTTVTYVDATAEFAEVFGLDENNQAQGTTDTTVDLTAKINALHGAKLNADSTVSGTIDADEPLTLKVILDVNEEDLGFKLTDICTGQWNWENTAFTLGYTDGTCGLVVTGKTTANAKQIIINTDPVNVTALAAYNLIIYDKGLTNGNKLFVNNVEPGKGIVYASANNEEYVKYTLNIGAQFPNEKVVNKIGLAMGQLENHSVFIAGIEKVEYKRETVIYSVANGNIAGIASTLGVGTVEETAEGLHYNYAGDSIIGAHKVGFVFDLGVRAADYQSIKVKFQKTVIATNDKGVVVDQPTLQVFCDGVEVYAYYNQTATVEIDLITEAQNKGITLGNISTLELAVIYWANVTQCDIYVKSIELVLKETLPEIEDVTYGVNLVTNGGTVEGELTSYVFGKGATLPANVTKENYNFDGWYLNSDFSGEPVTEIGTNEFGNKTYYAKYVGKTYNVQFVTDGGTLESELDSYVYGEGATLPSAQKEGFAFAGWYLNSDFSGEPVTEISASDSGDLTFYANYTKTMYSVQVLVAQCTAIYSGPNWVPGTITYVDATADFAEIFGLDENNCIPGKAGDVADITSIASTIKGAKVNAGSILSGTVAEDNSLQLVVKLDFNEEYLGFKVSDIVIGQYGLKNDAVKFTLKYYDGVFGVAIDGEIENVREITIPVTELVLADYYSLTMNYYEKSSTTNTKMSALSEVKQPWTGATETQVVAATNPTDYVKTSINLLEKYSSTLTSIKQITFRVYTTCEKHIFIGGIEKVAYKRESVTYSAKDETLSAIANSIAPGTISKEDSYNFGTVTAPALHYSYNGENITKDHMAGVVFDLGGMINVDDYKSITIIYRTFAGSNNTRIYLDNNLLTTEGGGSHTTDIIALAKANNITITPFSKIELCAASYANVTTADIYVASIELVLNPQSVTYSIANGNITDIVSPLNGGTISTVDEYSFSVNGAQLKSSALVYTYVSDTAISVDHTAGVKLNLGYIKVSDYKTIKITVEAKRIDGSNANVGFVYCDSYSNSIDSRYTTTQVIDVKAACGNTVEAFSELEISLQGWAGGTSYVLYIASIELEVADAEA